MIILSIIFPAPKNIAVQISAKKTTKKKVEMIVFLATKSKPTTQQRGNVIVSPVITSWIHMIAQL